MVAGTKDLWSLVQGRPEVDPSDLAEAVEAQARREPLDYRTRLLIRDSVEALRTYWGEQRLEAWLAARPSGRRIKGICGESFEHPGFPSLRDRIVEKTDPETVRQYLRELGSQLHRPAPMQVGGSIALILPELLSRHTEDVDVVDEVPAELLSQHQLLANLRQRYGLGLTHFQSHFLPTGWEQRLHSLPPFGRLHVFLVDGYDVFLSKLFSHREKDLDDLRAVAPLLDKEALVRNFRETTAPLRAEARLLQAAEKNWYILYGEPLPS
jgi:hypothetical protein